MFWVDNIPEIDCTQESWDQKLITLSSKTGDYITLTKVWIYFVYVDIIKILS